jgi:hypothetical protein
MRLGVRTSTTLPTASSHLYFEFIVTDALAPVVGANAVFGGSAKCKVISIGTGWRVTAVL